jgi:hypothetical protein
MLLDCYRIKIRKLAFEDEELMKRGTKRRGTRGPQNASSPIPKPSDGGGPCSPEGTADLWVDVGDAWPIRPPVSSRSQILPLEELSWENFERLCYRLASRSGDVTECRRYGVQGQAQNGIDIYVRNRSSDAYITWQCKKYRRIAGGDIKSAVTKFLDSDWADKTSLFQFAVSADATNSRLADVIEKEAALCKSRKIEFVVLDKNALSASLKECPDLVDDFFGRAWVAALCGPEAVSSLGRRRLTKEQRLRARGRLRDLYLAHFAVIDIGLPIAARGLREAVPDLSLRQRYVPPAVDSLNSVLEHIASPTRKEVPENEDPRSSNLEPEEGEVLRLRLREYRSRQQIFEWLATVDKGLILGGPGLGKSAALHFVVLDLLSDEPTQEALAKKWGGRLPIHVPFATLVRLVSEGGIDSIAAFLRSWLEKLGATEETLQLLSHATEDERLLLVVDGLDEWTDPVAAASALTLVLNFAAMRRLPLIASARPLGYERLGALGPDWKKAEIRGFEIEQQTAFSKIWFEHFHRAAQPPENTSENLSLVVERVTEAFISEVSLDRDLTALAGNPLLLSALIFLRLTGRVLPHNRYEALEEITRALIQEQPRRRAQASLCEIHDPGQTSHIFERGLQFLAWLIHQQPGSDSVGGRAAHEALRQFFEAEEFRKPPPEAIALATRLIENSPNEVGILVRRQLGQIGFFHRSIQEYLAAKEVTSWRFEKAKDFILKKFCDPGWAEINLACLNLLTRQDEVDSILNAVRSSRAGPIELPLKQLLLARIVFGHVNCSPALGEKISNEIFELIEESGWMPLRKSLLVEAVRGLDSDLLKAQVRGRMEKWFPGRVRWRSRLYHALAATADDEVGGKLYYCLFNSNHEVETKEIADAIAEFSNRWPNLGNKLAMLISQPADAELIAPALHALCAGWPNHPQIPGFLENASTSGADHFKLVALLHRAKRGETSHEIKRALAVYHDEGMRAYPWEEDLMETLCTYWAADPELRQLALGSARKSLFRGAWFQRYAFQYLLRCFPNDDSVAKLLADMLSDEDDVDLSFHDDSNWKYILSGYKTNSRITPAVEKWMEKYGLEHHSSMTVAHLAMLARTKLCKRVLIDRLKAGEHFPQWTIDALVDLSGPDDAEVRAAVIIFMSDEKRLSSMANFLPLFVKDATACREKLLSLLLEENGFDFGHVLSGLAQVGATDSVEVMAAIDQRLKGEQAESFWWHMHSTLARSYSHHPAVKAAALKALNGPEHSLYVIAPVYARDKEFRPVLESLLGCLHEDLRRVLVQSLAPLVLKRDPFARNLLASFEAEPDGEARVAAAYAHHSAAKRLNRTGEKHLKLLVEELHATGEICEERRASAVAGLLALGHPEMLVAAFNENHGDWKLSLNSRGQRNWSLLEILVELWEGVLQVCGKQSWTLFRDWDVLVIQLAQAGRRKTALQIPRALTEDAFTRQSHTNVDVFLARAILNEGQESFKDFCINLFERTRKTQVQHGVGWGKVEEEVWFEAAAYLARQYSGNSDLETTLENLVKDCTNPAGPLIALCRGWPSAPILREIWESAAGKETNADPSSAWLVSTKADANQLLAYIGSLPKQFQQDRLWGFPRETLRAMRDRLSRDELAQSLFYEHFGDSTDLDVVCSVSRLAGLTFRDRGRLREWAQNRIMNIRLTDGPQPMGYDMLSGKFRPVEFCLLEACLTN